MPDRPHQHDPKEHAILINIDIDLRELDLPTDHIRITDFRSGDIRLDLDDHANDGTFLDVCRALHDRRSDLYHAGEYQHGCQWCDDNAFDLAARRAGPPGDGQ